MNNMRKSALLLVLLILVLVSASLVNAQVQQQGVHETLHASKISVSYYIAYDKVLVDTQITFAEPASGTFEVRLPLDARAITLHADKTKAEPIMDYNLMRFGLDNNTHLRYQYISESVLEKDSFIANIISPIDSAELYITVSLPEEALLEKSVSDRGIDRPSVFPKPSKLHTDGRVIDIVWFIRDVEAGEEVPVLIRYIMPMTLWPILLTAFIVVIIAIGIIILIRKRKHRPKVVIVRPRHIHSRSPDVEQHLKEDEEQIVTILKDREGKCEQGTMRVITGFSKAKLSGLLKELEQRKVIHKEKRGKKNLVFLKR